MSRDPLEDLYAELAAERFALAPRRATRPLTEEQAEAFAAEFTSLRLVHSDEEDAA